MMTRYFATCFDRAYLVKGLALYESLVRHSSSDFCLYVLALDESTRIELARLKLEKAIVIEIGYFEHQTLFIEMRHLRQERTWQEYCWTLASQFTQWLLRTGMRECTYLDADLFFFADPETAFTEIGERSIAITPHRLIPEKKHLEVNGIYNVGFVHFKNTAVGRQCLSIWATQVVERCSAADGCGDQQYLNEWPGWYGNECCIIQNIGVNAGPWSIGNWHVTEGPRLDGEQLIAYHFHELAELEDGSMRLTNYDLREEDVVHIYRPYLEAYRAAKERIAGVYVS